MNNEEEKRCPLCAEAMDWTDQQLNPCKCGYEVCVWCWHHIMDMAEKDASEGRCPACRTPYDKDKIVGLEANFQRVDANSSSRKQKLLKAKPKPNEGRKDLSNVRVIQRRMAYIIGLPLGLADEELLQRKDYLGQYGKITKICLSRTAAGAVQQFINDTCSVYITYSKEEEAVRCIQSVHGYVLEGRLLRASFGTAKYCHSWLRNMPCNNPACLYLHTVGAEEDSFGKDEVAAVHTRNRVEEIVGATRYLHGRSGSMLPPPIVEQLNSHSASAEEPVCNHGLKDVAYAAIASGDHLPCSKDKDGPVRSSKQMATFVDIVGRSCNSGSNKDGNSFEEERMLNLSSDSNHVETESSDSVLLKSSTPSQLVNSVSRSKLYSEPFREASKLLSVERDDSNHDDTSITKEKSGLVLDSGRQVLHYPCNTPNEDSPTFDDQRSKDSVGLSRTTSFIPSYPAKTTKNYSDHSWHTEYHSQISADHDAVNSYADEESIQSTGINSVLNDGYNEKKFQSSAKSDRIYRGSNSFSNEEIVEHLRRLDHDTLVNNDEKSAAVESSIISNILSMDLGGCDNSAYPQTVAGLFEARDMRHGSSWNFQNNDQSRFSFAKEHGFSSQQNDLGSPSINIGQELNFSVLQDSCENKDYLYKSQHQASRAQNLTPPGFSMPSKPPPGFSAACIRTEQVVSASSGNYFRASNSHYRSPSSGNLSNSSDDLIDPAIMVGGGRSSTNRLNNSWTSSFSCRSSSSFDEDTKLWPFMQQQSAPATVIHHHHQEPQFSQATMQQPHTPQVPSSQDDFFGGLTSGLVELHQQSYNPSLLIQQQYYQPNFANRYQQHNHLGEAEQHDPRSEVERFGFDSFLPGYMFQMPTSGDVYTRVFGM